ncbi:RNA-directed DNA polymerase, eukaryota [Tanacetum coccineum]
MRSTPTTTTTTTPVTNAQLKALIDQGVVDALAARDADRSMNGDDNHNSGTGGTKGVVELTQWFEKMETVFCISNCSVENQIKFSTCTLLGSALTWWNSHVRTVGHDVAYAMTWTDLKKKMTDKYCPRSEIKKLEVKMWNLKVKELDKIERYVGGLPDMIHGKNKRKQDDNNNQAQQQPPKKQVVAITYTVGFGERKESPAATNNQRNPTCYECRNQGHYMNDFLKLKNQNHGNQTGGTRAREMVHALGGGEINQDLNNMELDINA